VVSSTTQPPKAATVSPAAMGSAANEPMPLPPAARACAFGVSQLKSTRCLSPALKKCESYIDITRLRAMYETFIYMHLRSLAL
jgi:hypothetical protein